MLLGLILIVSTFQLAHKMLLHSMSAYPSTDITELIKEYLLTASHVTLSEQVRF